MFRLLAACVNAGVGRVDATEPSDSAELADPTPDAPLLDASFGSRLRDGYHCGLDWYLARDTESDSANTIRLGADLNGFSDPDEVVVDDMLSADFADGVAVLSVYVGECLWTPGCTDVVTIVVDEPCAEQRISHIYDAVAGDATLRLEGDGSVSGEVTDLVLEGRDGEPSVEVADLALPALPEWVE